MTTKQPSTRSQQLVFTLYGDYLRYRADEVWTGALIHLLDPLGLSSQAVRSTLSRMSRLGWLDRRRLGRHSFYRMTPRSHRVLEDGARHLFTPRREPWDGQWRIVSYGIPEKKRALRDRLRERLTWLGFGRLATGAWISPYDPPADFGTWLETTGARPYVEQFTATHLGHSDPRDLVGRAWDLAGLNRAYRAFLRSHSTEPAPKGREAANGNGGNDVQAFSQRFQLTLSFLSFPYVDPGLPGELLPEDWLGEAAARLFREQRDELETKAWAFVDGALAGAPAADGRGSGASP